MIDTVLHLLAAAALALGLIVMLVGALGIVRLPDAYNRLHAASKCSTLGLMAMLAAVALALPDLAVWAKCLVTTLFLLVANPVGAHLLAKAALKVRSPMWQETGDENRSPTQAPGPKPPSAPRAR